MSDIAEFLDMMGSTLTVYPPSTGTRSMFGTQAHSTQNAKKYRAHLLWADGSNRRLYGIDEQFNIVAWVASTSTSNISRDSVIVLPDGSTPPVKAVSYPRDDDGTVHHTKVMFG